MEQGGVKFCKRVGEGGRNSEGMDGYFQKVSTKTLVYNSAILDQYLSRLADFPVDNGVLDTEGAFIHHR